MLANFLQHPSCRSLHTTHTISVRAAKRDGGEMPDRVVVCGKLSPEGGEKCSETPRYNPFEGSVKGNVQKHLRITYLVSIHAISVAPLPQFRLAPHRDRHIKFPSLLLLGGIFWR